MADKLPLDRSDMKDPSTSYLRIYVGGIPDITTADDLYEHFKGYGKIMGIALNRLFGFVQFAEESSAQAAISQAGGGSFLGKCISVKTAQTAKRETDMVQEIPAASTLSNNLPGHKDEGDEYDSQGNYVGDKNYDEDYDARLGHGGSRGRAIMRGRRVRVRGKFHERSPGSRSADRSERGGYERFTQPDYPRALPIPDRNDCEIIVVSKGLTEYAEYIESRLKRLGIVVDLLFPMEDVAIGKVLANIASRGCLFAILVMPQNQENRSLTLTILHGLPQEHRNMPIEDALQLLSRNFQEVQRGGSSGREALCALLGQLADGRTLTVLQYDKVIEYLQERREMQVKLELGEPLSQNKAQVDLQQRILTILNDKNITSNPAPVPTPSQPTEQGQNKLFEDPTVKKALDAILLKFT